MASSDDEGESVVKSVVDYYFVDNMEEPVSFSHLPIRWNDEGESSGSNEIQIFLRGKADDGPQKIYKQVTAWKFGLVGKEPQVSVLSKERVWIKLVKPRKSYEDVIRPILVTLHFLRYVRKNPETSGNSLGGYIRKACSSYEVKPSLRDLMDHLSLIRDAVQHDESLSASKFLLSFIEKPLMANALFEDVQIGPDNDFLVGDDEEIKEVEDEEIEEVGDEEIEVEDGEINEGVEAADEGESDEESDLFDSVCSICDNGGDILCCEGECLRSFHAIIGAGADSKCETLRMTKAEVKALKSFLCTNCQFKQHQCYACGKLGSSDRSSHAEVFPCVSATCGYFFHPECIAKLLHPMNEAEAEESQKKIATGESFTCPAHNCHVCKHGENKDDPELQFAVCRRCPRAYHRKCLPREIAFDNNEDGYITRAWNNLLANNRALIYCLKHTIDKTLGTPKRDHLKYPKDPAVEEKKRKRSLDLHHKQSFLERSSFPCEPPKKHKPVEKVSSLVKESDSPRNKEKHFFGQGNKVMKKSEVKDDARDSSSAKLDMRCAPLARKMPVGEDTRKSTLPNMPRPPMKKLASRPITDPEMKKRLLALMRKVSSRTTLEEIIKNHKMPSTHAFSLKTYVEKTITPGKVEHFVEAVRTALKKLEEGCNVEDAKAVCGPDVLNQIVRWKNKLKVFLSPFLHGMRYTSFGRHFTKIDKLEEVVDKLHWYIQNGDMIVDFCCGANDFSVLLKKKLEETGKSCSYKNYDLIQPKNDFNFVMKDWMTVRPKELPTGSKLIMGLNPPFGVNAQLANKFIDKALEFNPKLLILIVPKETQRLDEKKNVAYDLVWEDNQKFSGKSFYLPGSVDVYDKQMDQWNNNPPVLSLWSRSDWIEKHKDIASTQGHRSTGQRESHVEEYNERAELRNDIVNEFQYRDKSGYRNEADYIYPSELEVEFQAEEVLELEKYMEATLESVDPHDVGLQDMEISPAHEDHGDDSSHRNNLPGHDVGAEPEEPVALVPGDHLDSSPHKHVTETGNHILRGSEGEKGHHGNSRKSFREQKDRQDKGKQSRGQAENTPNRKDFLRPQGSKIQKVIPPIVSSSFNSTDTRILSEAVQTPTKSAYREEAIRPFQHDLTVSGSDFVAEHEGLRSSTPGDDLDAITRRYSSNETDAFATGTNRWSTSSSLVREYGMQGPEDQIPTYSRDNVDTLGRTPFPNELDDNSRRESVLAQLRLYGRQDPDLTRSSSHPPPYGSPGSSAMQRYVPRLDELNHIRPSGFGSPVPPMVGRYQNAGFPYAPGPQRPILPDSLRFAPPPPRPPFPHQNSFGWLSDD